MALIAQSDSRLYMFSSDYPHTEGGRHPLGRFTASMADCDAEAHRHFFSDSFARMFAS